MRTVSPAPSPVRVARSSIWLSPSKLLPVGRARVSGGRRCVGGGGGSGGVPGAPGPVGRVRGTGRGRWLSRRRALPPVGHARALPRRRRVGRGGGGSGGRRPHGGGGGSGGVAGAPVPSVGYAAPGPSPVCLWRRCSLLSVVCGVRRSPVRGGGGGSGGVAGAPVPRSDARGTRAVAGMAVASALPPVCHTRALARRRRTWRRRRRCGCRVGPFCRSCPGTRPVARARGGGGGSAGVPGAPVPSVGYARRSVVAGVAVAAVLPSVGRVRRPALCAEGEAVGGGARGPAGLSSGICVVRAGAPPGFLRR
jgi:hypothetical protein